MTPEPFISCDVEDLHHSDRKPAAPFSERQLVNANQFEEPGVSYRASSSHSQSYAVHTPSSAPPNCTFSTHPASTHEEQRSTEATTLEAENVNLEAEIRRMAEEKKAAEAAEARVRAREKACEADRAEDVARLRKEVEELKGKQAASGETIDRAGKAREWLEEESRTLQGANSELQHSLEVSKKHEQASITECNSFKASLAKATEKLSVAQITIVNSNRQHDTETAKLKAKNSSLTETVRGMTEEAKATADAAVRVTAEIKHRDADRDGEIVELREEVEEWRGKLAECEGTVGRVRQERDACQKECRRLEIVTSTMRQTIEAAEENEIALVAERDSLDASLAKSTEDLSAIRIAFAERRRQRDTEIADLKAESSSLTSTLRRMTEENTAKEEAAIRIRVKEREWETERVGDVVRLREEVEEWKRKHAASEEALDRVRKERDACREDCRKLELDNATLQDASRAREEALAVERDSLKTALATSTWNLSASEIALGNSERQRLESQQRYDQSARTSNAEMVELQTTVVMLRKETGELKKRDVANSSCNVELSRRLDSVKKTLEKERAEHAKVVGAARTVLDALETAKKAEADARRQKVEVEVTLEQRAAELKEAKRSAMTACAEVVRLQREKEGAEGELQAMQRDKAEADVMISHIQHERQDVNKAKLPIGSVSETTQKGKAESGSVDGRLRAKLQALDNHDSITRTMLSKATSDVDSLDAALLFANAKPAEAKGEPASCGKHILLRKEQPATELYRREEIERQANTANATSDMPANPMTEICSPQPSVITDLQEHSKNRIPESAVSYPHNESFSIPIGSECDSTVSLAAFQQAHGLGLTPSPGSTLMCTSAVLKSTHIRTPTCAFSPDVVTLIAGFVAGSNAFGTLANMNRVDRNYHRITLPVLYETVVFDGGVCDRDLFAAVARSVGSAIARWRHAKFLFIRSDYLAAVGPGFDQLGRSPNDDKTHFLR